MAAQPDPCGEPADFDECSYLSHGLREPWEDDRSTIPATDDDTIALIDQAIGDLVAIRAPFEFDVLPTISVLVSLGTEVECRLPDAVADACDCGYCWEAIVTRLDITAASARRRYAGYVRWRESKR
jgi:hypothetical protein